MKPSSTFNSETPKRAAIEVESAAASWISSLILAVVLSVVVLFSYDSWLRKQGAVASFDNSNQRWAQVRDQLQHDPTADAIALLGASRMQGNMSLQTFDHDVPGANVYQLAVAGRSPYATLADIAHNTDFRGTLIISIMAPGIVEGPFRDEQASLVDYYHQNWNWARKVDTVLDDTVSGRFVFTDDHYEFRKMLQNVLWHGRLFNGTDNVQTTRRRERLTNFDVPEIGALRTRVVQSFRETYSLDDRPTKAQWDTAIAALSDLVTLIRDRGGQVVFVRMPSSGELRALEQQVYPRSVYWDDMAARVPADAFVHVDDFEALSHFETPDFSHIDRVDVPAFTAALIDVLQETGVDLDRDRAGPSTCAVVNGC